MEHAGELGGLRAKIEDISTEIVRLLAERMELSRKIAEAKTRLGKPIVDIGVERQVRAKMLEEARRNNVPEELVNRITTLLIHESIKAQKQRTKPTKQITHFDIFRRARELEKEGKKVIRLEVGEPDLGAPQEVAESTAEAVKQGLSRYSDSRGIAQLREKLAEYLSERHRADVKPDNIIITPGGRFAIYLAMQACLSMGDEVVVIDPSWPMYKQCAEFLGIRPVVVNTTLDDGWTPDAGAVEDVISPSTRAIVLNYPCNPTGKVLDKKAFGELVEVARKHGLYVISDEVYADYSFSGRPPSILEEDAENYIMVSSFSKSWGMTGYRVGYITAPSEVINRMAQINGMLITCVPEFIQYGALKALDLHETVKRYSEIMKKRMEAAVKALSKIPASYHRPEGGMYVFPRLNVDNLDSIDFALDLLEKKKVALAPGTVFGDYKNYVRISLGAPEEDIVKGIELIGEYLRENS